MDTLSPISSPQFGQVFMLSPPFCLSSDFILIITFEGIRYNSRFNSDTAVCCLLFPSSCHGKVYTAHASYPDPRRDSHHLCVLSRGQQPWLSYIVPASYTPHTVDELAGTPSLLSSMLPCTLWPRGTVSPRGALVCEPRSTWFPKEPARHTRDVGREPLV